MRIVQTGITFGCVAAFGEFFHSPADFAQVEGGTHPNGVDSSLSAAAQLT